MFQLFCYVYLNLSTHKDINFLAGKSSSTNRRNLVVWKRDRYARA